MNTRHPEPSHRIDMKTSLDHLPERKRLQLKRATEIICELVKPEMLILFGSYARGDWVEEKMPDGVYFQYQSDFDLLVVTRHESQAAKVEQNDRLAGRLRRDVKTPVGLISEDINLINRRLSKGHYFYTDIQREGIMLYTSGQVELAEPGVLSMTERHNLARENFDQWFDKAGEFVEQYEFAVTRGHLSTAAFLLHQAAERLYAAISLVFTHYKPRTHDLEKLNQWAGGIEPLILTVFGQDDPDANARFQLLRKAYVDARYSRTYSITAEELEWLGERVRQLREMTASFCEAKIESFRE